MTNEHRKLVREATDEERGLPCVVRHEEAGGQCERLAAEVVYGIYFCEVHGPEARMGALEEATYDAEMFFERFRNPYAPKQSRAIRDGLEAALEHLYEQYPSGEEYDRALLAAYPNPPDALRERIRKWRDDEEGRLSVFDSLMYSINTLRQLMRIAFENEEPGIVELLELQREGVAAEAAFAREESKREEARVS